MYRTDFRLPRALILLLALFASTAQAHALLPSLWQATESGAGPVDFVWTTPTVLPQGVLPPTPRLPPNCTGLVAHTLALDGTMRRERWSATCAGGLRGTVLAVEGLAYAGQQVLVSARFADGKVQDAILNAEHVSLVLGASNSSAPPQARAYFTLGVEHILTGWDHLAFVTVLVLTGWRLRQRPPLRWLMGSITAFTLGHSLTLACAALGWVQPVSWLVETGIAASIVWVARSAWRLQAMPAQALSRPWIGMVFGLLHGLGFAGALADIGLPEDDRVAALLWFNVGIESGQLLFLGVILLPLISLADHYSDARGTWRRGLIASLGVLAGYWFWARLLAA